MVKSLRNCRHESSNFERLQTLGYFEWEEHHLLCYLGHNLVDDLGNYAVHVDFVAFWSLWRLSQLFSKGFQAGLSLLDPFETI